MLVLPFRLCDLLIVMCALCSLVVFVSGLRLYKHRIMLDSKYIDACKQLEKQQHEIELDTKWLERKTKELERREDRILQRENELNFLK